MERTNREDLEKALKAQSAQRVADLLIETASTDVLEMVLIVLATEAHHV